MTYRQALCSAWKANERCESLGARLKSVLNELTLRGIEELEIYFPRARIDHRIDWVSERLIE